MSRTPKTVRAWSILKDEFPIERKGDAEPDNLHLAIGRALSAWEMMDEFQGMLFARLVRSKKGSAEAAYGVVEDYSKRSDMVKFAARSVLPENSEFLAEIEQTLKDTGNLATKRNHVAHGIVGQRVVHEIDDDGKKKETASGYYVAPASYATKKRASQEKLLEAIREFPDDWIQRQGVYAYTAAQVAQISGAFIEYQRKMIELVKRSFDELKA